MRRMAVGGFLEVTCSSATWIAAPFSHDGAGERLSLLHDDYTLLDDNGNTTEDVDAEVMAASSRTTKTPPAQQDRGSFVVQ
jgi:hypothetical protein